MRVGTRPRATGGGIWHELVVRDMAVGTEGGGGGAASAAADDARTQRGNSGAPKQDVTLRR